jgi:ferrous iron transport protein B
MGMYEVSTNRVDGRRSEPADGVLLVGPPNVGKSSVFGALTRSYVTVSNYPGTTVEIASGTATVDGRTLGVIDTPGVHSFVPSSDDERAARDMLLERRYESVVVVGDAKNLERVLTLALQLAEMDYPYLLCLNMVDEAGDRGIRVDTEALSRRLGVPVVPTVAVRGQGIPELRDALADGSSGAYRFEYPPEIECAVSEIEALLPQARISARSLALMVLAGDDSLMAWIRERVPQRSLSVIEGVRERLNARFHEPLSYLINEARFLAARVIANEVTRRAGLPPAARVGSHVDRFTIHPLWGIPVLGVVLYGMYLFVGVLGAGTLVDWFEGTLFGEWINPWTTGVVERFVPFQWLRDLLVGEYGVVTMALTYALALILPIVGTFFLAFGVLEDSGYLPRLAVILNRVFQKIGLNGKAVLPMVLGLGCDTMATLTTRILETRKERLIVTLLLALAIPCSAQLAVILAMIASMSAVAVGVWLVVVAGVIVIVGALAARVLPGRGSDFVLELPPLRVPRLGNIGIKTLARIEWYLREAVPLFVLGTLVLFLVDRLGVLGRLERLAEPVITGLLGLPGESASAFLIGFLRRDFGAAGMYEMARAGALDPIQVVVAVTTITLFIPCIANFFVIVKERGLKTGVAVAAFVLPFALAVGAALNAVLRMVDLPLGGGVAP